MIRHNSKIQNVNLFQCLLSGGVDPLQMPHWCPHILYDGAVFLFHFAPFPTTGSKVPSRLECLAFGKDGFAEGGGGGASAEGGAAQRDLGLPAGDGGGPQGGGAPAPRDGGVPHRKLALAPLDGGVAQG